MDVDAKIHIYTAAALGRGRVGSPTLGRILPPVLILMEAEWTPGPIWTRRRKEKSSLLQHPSSNPGRPARSQASCRLSYLGHSIKKIRGATAPKSQDRLKRLLPEGSTGGLVVSKALIPQP